ncbi:uL15m family ribosomal protein [Thermoproteota archaeon]
MVVHKSKKNVRQRAGTTHGWGSMKKHRGAGHRGGRGKAGTGKRGDAMKPSYWKKKKYFGINGFASRYAKINAINLKQLDDNAESWVRRGLIEQNAGVFKIDLNKIGCDKLLGTGKITKKFEIAVKYASPKAVDKVSGAGGKVILPVKKESPKVEAPKAEAPAEKEAASAKEDTK